MLFDYYSTPTIVWIGIGLQIVSIVALLANLVVIKAIFNTNLLLRESNSVHILSTFNIFTCTCRLLLVAVYWAPSTIAQSPLFETERDGPFNNYSTIVCLSLWAEASVTQMLIGLNRLFTVEKLSLQKIFCRDCCKIYAAAILPICFGIQYTTAWLSPCCNYIFNYTYATMMPNKLDEFNYSIVYVFRPVNILTITVPVLCYITIFGRVFKRSNVSNKTERPVNYSKKIIPFALVFIFNLGLYLCVEFEHFYVEAFPRLTSVKSFFAVLDCSVTGLIHGIMNHQIRESAKRVLMGLPRMSNAISTTSSHSHFTKVTRIDTRFV